MAVRTAVIGLDTNVLLRALIDKSVWPDDSPGHMRAARDLVLTSGETFYVNLVVLVESVWVLENPLAQPKPVLIDILEKLLSAANVVLDHREAVAAALDGFRRGKPGFTDHLLGQVNRHAGCEATVTFDARMRRSELFRQLKPKTR
ncbi:PIN domain-containing protein [Enterovirga sp. CN4-39]|uniref:PIN domain-containing protein n=1 Tax=Enterovirga sp. CN4-39 TaxID=3400910 RepID=UPI003C09CA4D